MSQKFLFVLVSFFLLGACGDHPKSTSEQGSQIPIPLLSEENRLLMFKASAQVLDQCMVNHAFTGYKTFVPRHLNRNQYSDAIPDLGVLHSQPSDTAYGFQAQLKATKEAPGPKFPLDDPYLQSLSESELSRMTTVMRGTKIITVRSATGGFVNVRADGCAHEANSAVYP